MRWTCVGLVLLLLLLVSCADDPPPDLSGPADDAEAIGDLEPGERRGPAPVRWPYWPARMRIHPLTLVAPGSGEDDVNVEARLEFRDRDGITCRAVGQVRFDLFSLDPDAPHTFVNQWNIDLRSLESNTSHFDDVTRTYLFKLRIDRENLPDRGELRAYFLGADGAELLDERSLAGG